MISEIVVRRNFGESSDYTTTVEIRTDGGWFDVVCENVHNGYYPRGFYVSVDGEVVSEFSM